MQRRPARTGWVEEAQHCAGVQQQLGRLLGHQVQAHNGSLVARLTQTVEDCMEKVHARSEVLPAVEELTVLMLAAAHMHLRQQM